MAFLKNTAVAGIAALMAGSTPAARADERPADLCAPLDTWPGVFGAAYVRGRENGSAAGRSGRASRRTADDLLALHDTQAGWGDSRDEYEQGFRDGFRIGACRAEPAVHDRRGGRRAERVWDPALAQHRVERRDRVWDPGLGQYRERRRGEVWDPALGTYREEPRGQVWDPGLARYREREPGRDGPEPREARPRDTRPRARHWHAHTASWCTDEHP